MRSLSRSRERLESTFHITGCISTVFGVMAGFYQGKYSMKASFSVYMERKSGNCVSGKYL
jgi:hypothetical protein